MFKKAKREGVPAKILLSGPSGSGKSLSALYLAQGLGEKIAGICTENGSLGLYSDKVDFDQCVLSNHSAKSFIDAIVFAENNGYDVLVIDSITHLWKNILEMVEASNQKNDFAKWTEPKKQLKKFKDIFKASKLHIIATCRSKTAYEIQEKESNGYKKRIPEKIGMKDEFEDGFDYEVDFAFSLNQDHFAECHKDRSDMFNGFRDIISSEHGEKIKMWISEGYSVELDFEEKLNEMEISESDVINYLQKSKGMKIEKIEKRLKENMLNNWDSFKSDYEKFTVNT